jgi:NAD(P)H-hydrate epimerase
MPGIILMENAARAVAELAWSEYGGAKSPRMLILCGGGNNGGDGLAVARHLHNRGGAITLGLTVDPKRYTGDALINWTIINAMGLDIQSATGHLIESAHEGLIIDAIFGTGLTQSPRPPFPDLCAAVENCRCPVLAVDLPSGLDCDTGQPLGSCIRATRTVTFVAEKIGFAHPQAAQYTGTVTVADIGCPRELIERVAASGNTGVTK